MLVLGKKREVVRNRGRGGKRRHSSSSMSSEPMSIIREITSIMKMKSRVRDRISATIYYRTRLCITGAVPKCLVLRHKKIIALVIKTCQNQQSDIIMSGNNIIQTK